MNFKISILILFFCNVIFSQNVNFNRVVNEIKINGLTQLPNSQFLNSLNVKQGTRITEAQLVDDINTLFLSGYFKKVHAYTQENRKDMLLCYEVEENDIVEKIYFISPIIFSILMIYINKKFYNRLSA